MPSPPRPAQGDCGPLLRKRFPALFGGAPKPLKLRIQVDIQQRAPGVFSKQALSAFFRRYTGSNSYLQAVAQGAHRVDLDGQPAGEISDEHRRGAVDELARRRAVHEERRTLEEQRRNVEGEQRVLEAQQRRNRAGLLRDFERTTLTRANFCALKQVADEELDGLLERARQEAAEERELQARRLEARPPAQWHERPRDPDGRPPPEQRGGPRGEPPGGPRPEPRGGPRPGQRDRGRPDQRANPREEQPGGPDHGRRGGEHVDQRGGPRPGADVPREGHAAGRGPDQHGGPGPGRRARPGQRPHDGSAPDPRGGPRPPGAERGQRHADPARAARRQDENRGPRSTEARGPHPSNEHREPVPAVAPVAIPVDPAIAPPAATEPTPRALDANLPPPDRESGA